METTGRQALEARVLELEMRVPNLVALQERIDNVELSIAQGWRRSSRSQRPSLITQCRHNGAFTCV